MATWNGSYVNPEDPACQNFANYYVYPSRNGTAQPGTYGYTNQVPASTPQVYQAAVAPNANHVYPESMLASSRPPYANNSLPVAPNFYHISNNNDEDLQPIFHQMLHPILHPTANEFPPNGTESRNEEGSENTDVFFPNNRPHRNTNYQQKFGEYNQRGKNHSYRNQQNPKYGNEGRGYSRNKRYQEAYYNDNKNFGRNMKFRGPSGFEKEQHHQHQHQQQQQQHHQQQQHQQSQQSTGSSGAPEEKDEKEQRNVRRESSAESCKSGRKFFSDRNAGGGNRHGSKGNNEDHSEQYGSYKDRRMHYQDREFRQNQSYDNKNDRNKDKEARKDSQELNWRQKSNGVEFLAKTGATKKIFVKKYEIDDDASQRERLTEQLNRGHLECLVCCDYIRQNDYTWSCSNCYHVLHLKCIKKWATSSADDNGWRCPACQNVTTAYPEEYFCFCGKAKVPEWNRRDIAHSCGETCGRDRTASYCVHKCTLLCHPGSCPPCTAMVTKHCGCGRTSQTLQCSGGALLACEAICDKLLNCGVHHCEKSCHHGPCDPCQEVIVQECHCGKHHREKICEANIPVDYSCGEICNKLLDCGNHKCQEICHTGPCDPCFLTPEKISYCCCGKTPLKEPRKSCLDPIPTCDEFCYKKLKCGQPNDPHICKVRCHEGECPPCEHTTKVKCRCGNMDREIPCKDLTTKADDARCEKKCTKKRSCGKHKCNQLCCIDIEHICPLPCSKNLSCGRHRCEQTCHKGRCQPCWRSSFDELFCECGASVLYPPIPCGTRRPTCEKPCSREHSCNHPVLHNCHSELNCPPCTVLCQKWCYGKHELRKAVPCHVNEISCGLPCGKPVSCGRHKCILTCHAGPCERPGQICQQPCTVPRELCGHICGASCHEGPCPDVPCKEMVKVTCQCGHRSTTRACAENSKEYKRIASGILASKMADMQLGHSVNLEEVFGQGAKKQNQLKTLECNDECKLIERNRRLALGLQIVNPDLSGKLMPRYSDFMKQWAKKDSHFCQMVHDKLTELVQLAKTSKQKSRSYSFDCMNREKRQFVHEFCEHFGCESQAYDQEPKRNVVATAVKDKCWMPSYSLLDVVQRENGQRKVPGPMLNASRNSTLRSTELKRAQQKTPSSSSTSSTATPSTSKTTDTVIDYFDYQG